MKIAIIGSRGIPARWGGYETASEEISIGLVKLGHDVTVFCRPKYSQDTKLSFFNGVKLVYVPCFKQKILETFSHEVNCMLYAIRDRFDLIYVLGMRSSPIYCFYRLFRPESQIVMNPDGLDWKRRKWGKFGRVYLKFVEWFGVRFSSHHVVADSKAIKKYIQEEYRIKASYLPYGGKIRRSIKPEILDTYGLHPKSYFLVVARLEPENNTDKVIKAFEGLGTEKHLVIVGGTNYKSSYEKQLRETKDQRIKFTGPLYKPGHVQELFTNCFAYIHGHEVGGTNPALLDAMGCGCAVLAFDVEFNKGVLGNCGAYWKSEEDLMTLMNKVIKIDLDIWRDSARERINKIYRWGDIIKGYDDLFRRLKK